MEAQRYVVAVVQALEAANVPYMIVGSLSASTYGITRSTKDADFVIELGDQSIAAVMGSLGTEFHLEQQMAFETNTGTVKNVVHVADSGFLIELFRLSNDSHDRERFSRRRCLMVPPLGRDVFVPTAEDVIITKLRWVLTAGRSKDREDVLEVLAVQRNYLDYGYLKHWCDLHGTRAILDDIRAAIQDI